MSGGRQDDRLARGHAQGPPPTSAWAYRVALALLRAFFGPVGYVRTEVEGREHLPPAGQPAIVPINHTSALDIAAGYVINRPGYFAIKRESVELPLVGPFLRAIGAIPIQRDERDNEALRAMREVLRAGGQLGIAPEGTRSRTGRLGAYDPGFVWLASRTGATIVPCALHGAHRLLPKGERFPRPGRIWAKMGEPIEFAGRPRMSREQLQAEAGRIRAITLKLIQDLVAKSGVPNPALDEQGGDAGTDTGSVPLPHRGHPR